MFTKAIAETAETVTETAVETGFKFTVSNIISLLITAYCVLIGLASLLTGKVYGYGKSINNYTDESIAKFARPYGLLMFIAGIGLGVADLDIEFGKGIIFLAIGAVIVAAAAIGILVVKKKTLIKK